MELKVSQLPVVLIYRPWSVEGINNKHVGVDHVIFAWVLRILAILRLKIQDSFSYQDNLQGIQIKSQGIL